ncbi:MerR family transcriptional regulator [Desulfovibrio inopinatus]|uniref:MerR family transcriptional regulator n=1 Tax=Desulfovibrio inopinatus TaxID=102109 RepID=UPI0004006A89|nr:MerR family transcriptional regulator [Desulfovibrio inopinatus]
MTQSTSSQRTYKIGQVAKQTGLKTFVLRFWETEFPQLVPIRTKKGQRLYSDDHIQLIERIKDLLYNQGMTIEGARKRLGENANQAHHERVLREIEAELIAIRKLLSP